MSFTYRAHAAGEWRRCRKPENLTSGVQRWQATPRHGHPGPLQNPRPLDVPLVALKAIELAWLPFSRDFLGARAVQRRPETTLTPACRHLTILHVASKNTAALSEGWAVAFQGTAQMGYGAAPGRSPADAFFSTPKTSTNRRLAEGRIRRLV